MTRELSSLDPSPPPEAPEGSAARAYLRITAAVFAGTVVGAALQWIPHEPSPWRWLAFGVAYLAGGGPIVRDAWKAMREGRLSIDFLMGAAAVGAAVVGNPFEGAILIFLFSLSNTLEAFALGRTRGAVRELLDLRPRMATLAGPDGSPGGQVPADRVEPGQRLLIRPGERIPADGVVVDGSSEVDQAPITGESVPVRKRDGATVFAGTFNEGGSLVVEVTRPAHETMLARIVRLVEEARAGRAPAQRFIDRFAHPYTLAVVVAAALVAMVPPVGLGVPWGDAFYRSMTLLVVASPCALVISTPAAILSGIANGARKGVLFKGGQWLDLAGAVDVVAFDKTGTLTEGRPRLVDVESAAGRPYAPESFGWSSAPGHRNRLPEGSGLPASGGEEGRLRDGEAGGAANLSGKAGVVPLEEDQVEVLRVAASVERRSEHHLATAVLEAARAAELVLEEVEDFHALAGEGVQGLLSGASVWVGNRAMARRMGAEPGSELEEWARGHHAQGRSVVLVGREDRVVGGLAFGDVLKPDAEPAVHALRRQGVHLTILSGDHPDAARAVADRLGVEGVQAGLLPHQKVDAIRTLAEGSRAVAMVGDGINDAPAMASASLGIAMGAAGTDVAIETADVVIMSDEVWKVPVAIGLGRRTRRVVRQNVWFSVGWMALLVGLVGTVGLSLPLAVVAHEGSTLLVAANGLRLLRG